jgi:ABC-type sugar transport system ATPase subunit
MILDEPTRGIDVAPSSRFTSSCRTSSRRTSRYHGVVGTAELIGMCDRIYYYVQGRITGCLTRDQFPQETIMK